MKKGSNTILEDHGDWLEIDISTPKHPNTTMKMDKSDYELFRSYDCGRIYAWRDGKKNMYARSKSPEGVVLRVHKMIRPNWTTIDHINGDGIDNRSENLRECTQQQNSFNSRLKSTNKTGYAGVHQLPSGTWEARIMHNYKITIIGYFKEKADAIKARVEKELELFGEHSFLNRPQ